ncbi:nuclease-related domain-containing protein [uncultured Leifsonia sp.]|uniref:nuclease-related domain-containing protein n=1 Tax=uncultured Leifsonia sp. TaxID=340359 RepID=UPI0025DEDCF1|nr:nuclease-related domain-containing protein [uncultured Leifsonia sp.]
MNEDGRRAARMRDRAPGAAVMEQVVRLHTQSPPRSPLARALGARPLGAETEPWFAGALGEREVGALLDRLPPGWSAFHAVPVGTRPDESGGVADVDHVVVGPAGVFVINTKHHRGQRVWVGERAVLVSGQKQPYLRNSDLEASRVRGVLAQAGLVAPVTALVVLVGTKEVTVRQQPRRVRVLRAEALLRWLTRRPAVIDGGTVSDIARLFDDPATWRPAESSPDTLERFALIEREVRAARRVRAGWAVAAALAMLAVALPFLPH